jgi:hypothetical protein
MWAVNTLEQGSGLMCAWRMYAELNHQSLAKQPLPARNNIRIGHTVWWMHIVVRWAQAGLCLSHPLVYTSLEKYPSQSSQHTP